jgi:hypothetical protein
VIPDLVSRLTPILETYFSCDEFRDLVDLFEMQAITNDLLIGTSPSWLVIARGLVTSLEFGNCRRFVDNLLDIAQTRNLAGIAHSSWERRTHHEALETTISQAKAILHSDAAPVEISLGAGQTFAAKSHVRELLAAASDDILLVDPYIGVGTLDCLRDSAVRIRLLTGDRDNAIETGFDRAIDAFVSEGHQIDVRRADHLHDRHIVFNRRCWLVGGSFKDAGRKPFNCIEILDHKEVVVTELESRWDKAVPYAPAK